MSWTHSVNSFDIYGHRPGSSSSILSCVFTDRCTTSRPSMSETKLLIVVEGFPQRSLVLGMAPKVIASMIEASVFSS